MFIDCRFAARSVETKTIVTVIQHMPRSAIVVLHCSHDTVSLDCMWEGYSTLHVWLLILLAPCSFFVFHFYFLGFGWQLSCSALFILSFLSILLSLHRTVLFLIFIFNPFYFLVVGFGNYHLRCSPNATLLCKVETTGTHCQRHLRSHKKKRRTSVQGDDEDESDDDDDSDSDDDDKD